MPNPFSWSTTSATNSTADADINFAEGQTAASLNNSCRAVMAGAAMLRKDQSGELASTGSSNAYVLATNSGFTSLVDGLRLAFRANFANTAAATLNVNSTGTKALVRNTTAALSANDIVSGETVEVIYNLSSDHWRLLKHVTTVAAADISDSTAVGRSIVTAANAAAVRTAAGVVIGTDVQAYDAQLADVAGLTPTDNGVIIGNGTNFVVESGATLKTSLGLTIGADVQAYSANLDEYAAVNPTAAGLALLDDAAASDQRTTLGLGTAATLASDTDGTFAANSDVKIPTQKAVKTYVDASVSPVHTFAQVSTSQSTTTRYTGPNGNAVNAAEADAAFKMAAAGTVSAIYALTVDPVGGSGQTVTYTVMKNGVAQAVTCQIASGSTSASDTSHSFSYAAGDTISIRIVTSASAGATVTSKITMLI